MEGERTAPRPNARREQRNECPTRRCAIHRCILAGQLGHIAQREDQNIYKAAGNREVTLFPGSNLYERREKKGQAGADEHEAAAVDRGGRDRADLAALRAHGGEDRSRVGGELGAHLCTFNYSEPHYSAKAGRVLVTERMLLHGLEVLRQHIDFGKVDAVAATQIFIRGALIDCETRVAAPLSSAQSTAAREDRDDAHARAQQPRAMTSPRRCSPIMTRAFRACRRFTT